MPDHSLPLFFLLSPYMAVAHMSLVAGREVRVRPFQDLGR